MVAARGYQTLSIDVEMVSQASHLREDGSKSLTAVHSNTKAMCGSTNRYFHGSVVIVVVVVVGTFESLVLLVLDDDANVREPVMVACRRRNPIRKRVVSIRNSEIYGAEVGCLDVDSFLSRRVVLDDVQLIHSV